MAYRRWAEQEDAVLREKYGCVPIDAIAKEIGRPIGGIRGRALKLRICGVPEIQFECAQCGKHVVAGGYKEKGWADMRKRFCCAECEKKYWRHPPQGRESSMQNFRSIRHHESWEKFTNA